MPIPNITVDASDIISVIALQTKVSYWVLEEVMKKKKIGLSAKGRAAVKAGVEAAQSYGNEIMKLLGTLLGSETGQIILSAIGTSSKQLVIRPWLELESNAAAWATDFERAVQKGTPLFVRQDYEFTPLLDERMIPGSVITAAGSAALLGTGEGSNSVLEFSPPIPGFEGRIPESMPAKYWGLPGHRLDEILLHELTHAYRHMTGQSTRIPLLGHALKYGNTEEFFAILVSNIYISEMGGTKFRGDNDSAVLRPELTSIGAFFGDSDEGKSNRIALRLTKIDPVVFGKLARVRSAPFNPIRDIVIQSKLTHAVKSVKSLELRELLPSYLR